MRLCIKSFVAVATVGVATGLWAQNDSRNENQTKESQHRSELLARFSFTGSDEAHGFGQICMVVSRDRGDRVLRVTDNGETQRLRGKIAEDQFKNLKTLLDNSDFRTLSGTHGGLIRGVAEIFAAQGFRA